MKEAAGSGYIGDCRHNVCSVSETLHKRIRSLHSLPDLMIFNTFSRVSGRPGKRTGKKKLVSDIMFVVFPKLSTKEIRSLHSLPDLMIFKLIYSLLPSVRACGRPGKRTGKKKLVSDILHRRTG
jgi:hypothetical protein